MHFVWGQNNQNHSSYGHVNIQCELGLHVYLRKIVRGSWYSQNKFIIVNAFCLIN